MKKKNIALTMRERENKKYKGSFRYLKNIKDKSKSVVLRLDTNETYNIPFDKLSKYDQNIINEYRLDVHSSEYKEALLNTSKELKK